MTSTLAVGLDAETRKRVAELLSEQQLDVETASLATEALEWAQSRRFDLVACTYPLPDMVLRSFTAALRRADSASRDAAVLILTLPEMRAEANLGLPRGRSLVLSRRAPSTLLSDTVRQLLRTEPRREMSLPVSLEFDSRNDACKFSARTVNLSLSGMLVYHPQLPPVGSSCRFSLHLDGEPGRIDGAGTVVRHTSPKRERFSGFAVRFSDPEEARPTLARVIAKE